MGKPVIVVGDKTSHGGTVLEGDPTSTIEGKPIARLGDKVYCPKCKGTFPIVEGVVDTWYADKPVAGHGHKTACGATLIGSQMLVLIYLEPGNFKSAPAPESAATNQAARLDDFDHRFQLFDALTGVPMAKQSYRLHGPFGAIEGITDNDGFTKAIHTGDTASEVHIEIIGEGWPVGSK